MGVWARLTPGVRRRRRYTQIQQVIISALLSIVGTMKHITTIGLVLIIALSACSVQPTPEIKTPVASITPPALVTPTPIPWSSVEIRPGEMLTAMDWFGNVYVMDCRQSSCKFDVKHNPGAGLAAQVQQGTFEGKQALFLRSARFELDGPTWRFVHDYTWIYSISQ